jgi:leucine-zipper of insertion element IS481
MQLYGNAALSLNRRRRLVGRIVSEYWSLAEAAAAAEVSENTARKWRDRYLAEGEAGLVDRCSAPARVANRTPEQRVATIACFASLALHGGGDCEAAVDAREDGVGDPHQDRARSAGPPRVGARAPLRALAAWRADPH